MKSIFLNATVIKGGRWNITWLIQGIVFQLLPGVILAQPVFEETAPRRFHIEFIDKKDNPYSLDAPEDFLSGKSILRRQNQNIPLSENDLPVTPAYIDSIKATGAIVLSVSRWFNAVTILASSDSMLELIHKFTFVKKSSARAILARDGILSRDQGIQAVPGKHDFDYGPSGWQIMIHKGQLLHDLGYTGKGITIAVIDAGFYHVDRLPAFASLWENRQILGTRDFVNAGSNLYEGHSHGMVVLSVMGGNLPGELIGTAPDADYLLLRSEDTGSEYLIEEDNWVAAAEYADSAGADIIHSSLGYTQFDNPITDHVYSDMDGNTTRISRAADLAVSKGMVVVVSAGNQGSVAWHYISAPADADSVIAVGAIDSGGNIASFSSRGPSADHRVKPDVVAIGKGTWMADFESGIRLGNGTSLSSPIISGLTACLWQACRNATAMEVVTSIRESGDRFMEPDDDFGYGIPDFLLARVLLSMHQGTFDELKMAAFPNPFSTELYILFTSPVSEQIDVSLVDLSGRQVYRNYYPPFTSRSYVTISRDLESLSRGIYVLKVASGEKIFISKLIKF